MPDRVSQSQKWIDVHADLDSAYDKLSDLVTGDGPMEQPDEGEPTRAFLVQPGERRTTRVRLEDLMIASFEKDLALNEVLLLSNQRTHEAWKKVLLFVGVLAALTVAFLVGRVVINGFVLDRLDWTAVISTAGLIFEGAVVGFLVGRVKESQAAVDSGVATRNKIRQEIVKLHEAASRREVR